ncbi:hypothetical protein [Streptomyces sp. NPDC003015]
MPGNYDLPTSAYIVGALRMPGFRGEATTDWLRQWEYGMRSIGRPELRTLVLAVIRGRDGHRGDG